MALNDLYILYLKILHQILCENYLTIDKMHFHLLSIHTFNKKSYNILYSLDPKTKQYKLWRILNNSMGCGPSNFRISYNKKTKKKKNKHKESGNLNHYTIKFLIYNTLIPNYPIIILYKCILHLKFEVSQFWEKL